MRSIRTATARSSTKVGFLFRERPVVGGRQNESWKQQRLSQFQSPEFRSFVASAERQLLQLFKSIDRDRNGRLNKEDLQAAFKRAGLSVPMRRMSGFFDEIDMNRDGYISFDEWR